MSPSMTEIPEATAYGHFVGGAAVRGPAVKSIEVRDPVTGALIDQVPVGTERDVDEAVNAASAALKRWKRAAPEERARLLRRIGEELTARADEVALIESRNAGKSLANARDEVVAAAELFYFYSGVATQRYGLQVPMPDNDLLCYTIREPVGVVATITPWNYPLVIASGKIAAAMSVGCTVVAKPAPETPLTTILLARLAFDVGLPAGVLNVVAGDDRTGAALVRHHKVDKISFTGSTSAGRSVASAAAELGRPVVMELGGKSPNIVFDDVDVPAVVELVLMAGLTNGGQDCCSGSRILVQDSIADEFRKAAAAWLSQVRVGSSDGIDTDVNPIISERQRDRVSRLVDRALAEGAEILARREAPSEGFFYPPTILTGVESAMEICQTEIFGPVLTIETFTDADDAIAKGNNTAYGLAAGVWTSDIGRAIKCANELDAGRLWVNSYMTETPSAPWGGMKDSGYGSEMGAEGALEFTVTRVVYMQGLQNVQR
jgi:acyl-CoA reductase-like NAD-dependent aldehyde dehydrogenase